MRLADVTRPHAGGEAVGRVVALQHGVVLVLERNDGDDRAEDLLTGDLHVVPHAGEDGGLDEVALLETLGRVALPADQRLRAFLLAGLEVAAHAVELVLADEGADARLGVEAGALLHARGGLGELLGEFVVHLLLDEEARPGAAHLSGTEEHAEQRPLHGGLEIGVAEDDVGRLAPELEGDALQRARRLAVDLLPHLGRAGEGDLVDQGMVDERAAGRRSEAGDDVDDARRNPGFEQELPQTERGERRLLGGLQHGGVAAGQCGRELPGAHEEREVPGDDLPAHSHRLAQGEVEESSVGGVRLAVELGHPAGVVAEGLGGGRDVDVPALRERFPVVEEPRESAQKEGWCHKHQVQMKLNNGKRGSWWSHKTPDGQWCNKK